MTHFGSSTIRILPRIDLNLLRQLALPVVTTIAISVALSFSILFEQQIIYGTILGMIMTISLIFLILVIYIVYKSQKIFRVSESWLGGARP